MTVIVNSAKLQQLVTEIYLALGLSDAQAERLSDSLVAADLWGHSSHGVLRTSWYGERLKTGAMQACADIEILTDTGPLLALDGHNGIGQMITHKAVQMVGQRARQYGVGCASIRRSGHFGTAMYFTKLLAEQNMIGFLTTNASPSMAAFGGAEKLVGNNPQSWAAPTNLAAPFILDIAHTTVARGKLHLAKDRQESIPGHWAVSRQGLPTTDPAEAILGTLLPMAGHKGFGLSAMMDILSGVLSGGAFGTGVNGPYVADKQSGACHFLFAIDIAQVRELDAFKADMGQLIEQWKTSQKADGVTEIYYPGEKEHRHRQEAEQNGLFLADDTLSNLVRFAQDCGLKVTADTVKP